jgi:hypothetical protein
MENDKTNQQSNANPRNTDNITKKVEENLEADNINFEQQRGTYKNSDGLGVAGMDPNQDTRADQAKESNE